MGNKVSIEEELINLRITSKQMHRSAKKCEKNERAAVEKVKKVSRTIHDYSKQNSRSSTDQIIRLSNKGIVKVPESMARMQSVRRIKR